MEKNDKELEIAATHYTDEHEHIYAEYHAFIAGANWQKQQSAWIKCSDRMPENDRYVLVFIDGKVCPVVCLYSEDYWYEYGASCTRQDYTHWMELPAPPTDL